MIQDKQNSNLSRMMPRPTFSYASALKSTATATAATATATTATTMTAPAKSVLKTFSDDGRPTFYYNNQRNKPIRAGGVMFYKRTPAGIEFLMFLCEWKNEQKKFEDIGGKTDRDDGSIEETIAREVEEETNSKIKKQMVLDLLSKSTPVYNNRIKYLSYLIEAPEEITHLSQQDFGDVEEHTKWERTIKWVKKTEIRPLSASGSVNLKERVYESNLEYFRKIQSLT